MRFLDGPIALHETDVGGPFLAALRSPFIVTIPPEGRRFSEEGRRWRSVWKCVPGVGMAGYIEHRDGFREIRVFQGGN